MSFSLMEPSASFHITSSSVEAGHSIFARNHATDVDGTLTSLGHNLVANASATSGLSGTDIADTDAGITTSLVASGNSTPTHALGGDSVRGSSEGLDRTSMCHGDIRAVTGGTALTPNADFSSHAHGAVATGTGVGDTAATPGALREYGAGP